MSSDEESLPTPSSKGEEAPATQSSSEETPSSAKTDSENPTTQSAEKKVTQKPRTVPQSDWHFAFGPQKWYWVRIGDAWRLVRSSSSDWSDISIQDPYWVAFKHTTCFLVGGEDEDGEPAIYHTWNDSYMVRATEVDDFVKSREAFKKFHDWLDAKQLKDTSVSIGPKAATLLAAARHGFPTGSPKI